MTTRLWNTKRIQLDTDYMQSLDKEKKTHTHTQNQPTLKKI